LLKIDNTRTLTYFIFAMNVRNNYAFNGIYRLHMTPWLAGRAASGGNAALIAYFFYSSVRFHPGTCPLIHPN